MSVNRKRFDVVGVTVLVGLVVATVAFFVFVAGKGNEVARSFFSSPNLITTQEWNNLATEPSTKTNPPYRVAGGVVLAQKGRQGEFYQVAVEGKKLWIHQKYVKSTDRKPSPDVRLVAIR